MIHNSQQYYIAFYHDSYQPRTCTLNDCVERTYVMSEWTGHITCLDLTAKTSCKERYQIFVGLESCKVIWYKFVELF